MVERTDTIDTAIGAAIRAARFSRGLTQGDLAAHLGVTRATVASYEIGRRKITAETLIQIARLCGKSLAFFDPLDSRQAAAPATNPAPVAEQLPSEEPALHALIQALTMRPDAIPLVMEFLEAWLGDQIQNPSGKGE
ncbi:MAG TPA: helix-turn-helix transcriptional regulator [Roseiflexaceae bacterium]|nr:helix-turn-helix transcriptional regulator [Roseiflexaceae bacterium]